MDLHTFQFLNAATTNVGQALVTEYNAALVVLSYLTTVIASSASLLIASHVGADPHGRGKALWMSLGALTLGMGVWAMHFVAMLAMSLQVPIAYDVPITVISVIPAIVAGAVCLMGAIRGTTGWLVGSGLVMGLGIGAMHYVGMAAMRVSADMLYNPWLFGLSLIVAPLLAIMSLYTVRWALRQTVTGTARALILSGAIMGMAVSAMHYTGMWAVSYFPKPVPAADVHAAGMDSAHLAMLVAAAIFAIVALAVVAVVMDYRFKQLRAAACSEAEKFDTLLEAVPDGIIGVNADGAIRLLNSRIEVLFRYPKESLLGRPFDMLVSGTVGGTGVRGSATIFAETGKSARSSRFEMRGRRSDQSEFPAEISLNRITTADGSLTICAIRDVTEQEQARHALRMANEQLKAGMSDLESQSQELRFLTEMGELLHGCEEEQEAYQIISNLGGQLLPDTAGTVYMLSRSRNVLQSMAVWGNSTATMAPVFNPNDCWALRRGRIYAGKGRQAAIQCRHVLEDHDGYVCVPMLAQGEVQGVLHVLIPLRVGEPAIGKEPALDRKRILLIAVAEKISTAVANLRLREELRNQSIRDPLTGLLNRRYMEEAVEREIVRATRTGTRLSVVAIDLDHFKRFNDTFGHEGGDLVLREVGAVLAKKAHGDNLACRVGGEELMLILPDTDLETALSFAEKLRRKIETLAVMLRGQQLGKITASFGVAEYPLHGDDQLEVLRAADKALYRAKASGRNQVVVAERASDTTSVRIPAIIDSAETNAAGSVKKSDAESVPGTPKKKRI